MRIDFQRLALKRHSGSKTRFQLVTPCKTVEDGRSLVPEMRRASASKTNFSTYALEVPLRGTMLTDCHSPSCVGLRPSCTANIGFTSTMPKQALSLRSVCTMVAWCYSLTSGLRPAMPFQGKSLKINPHSTLET